MGEALITRKGGGGGGTAYYYGDGVIGLTITSGTNASATPPVTTFKVTGANLTKVPENFSIHVYAGVITYQLDSANLYCGAYAGYSDEIILVRANGVNSLRRGDIFTGAMNLSIACIENDCFTCSVVDGDLVISYSCTASRTDEDSEGNTTTTEDYYAYGFYTDSSPGEDIRSIFLVAE